MAITILENGWISDSFTMGEEPLIYNDAIVMPADEYNALTLSDIQLIKEERYKNWLSIINSPLILDPIDISE